MVQGEEYLFVSSILAWMSFTCNKLNSQAPIIMGKARIREHDIALIVSQNKGGVSSVYLSPTDVSQYLYRCRNSTKDYSKFHS